MINLYFSQTVVIPPGTCRRPVKIWNAARTVRKALVVSTYEEFRRIGREKLGLGKVEPIRVVLESDGTQVHATNNNKLRECS